MRRSLLRGLFVVVLVAAAVQLSVASLSSPNIVDRYQGANGSVVAETAPNPTVVSTSPREGADASLFVVGSDGEVGYYEERYRQYFDVDPVPRTTATIEFVARTGASTVRQGPGRVPTPSSFGLTPRPGSEQCSSGSPHNDGPTDTTSTASTTPTF
ncbi:hypothetical protein [Halobaculum sp. MBLA0143]|uniref:hypothetical protein n=1 Tax=Halobaculum sp. MBLA0143 TaxID=3079933 RepID=UPI003524D248